MPSLGSKPLTEAAHDAVIEEVRKETPAAVTVDVTASGVSAAVDVTKKGWAITAYARQLWSGGRDAGVRVSRPLSLLALIREHDGK